MNQQLLGIRQIEMNYFSTCFQSFGTISALLAGFMLQAITNLNLNQATADFGTSICSDVFWVSSAVVFATALHCMLTSILCNVFGPGLALRGPLGSMVRAVDGMIEEQEHIMLSFNLTVIFFAISVVAYFGMTMTNGAAIASSSVMLLGAFLWLYYCIRIMNRFKFTPDPTAWSEVWLYSKKQSIS